MKLIVYCGLSEAGRPRVLYELVVEVLYTEARRANLLTRADEVPSSSVSSRSLARPKHYTTRVLFPLFAQQEHRTDRSTASTDRPRTAANP